MKETALKTALATVVVLFFTWISSAMLYLTKSAVAQVVGHFFAGEVATIVTALICSFPISLVVDWLGFDFTIARDKTKFSIIFLTVFAVVLLVFFGLLTLDLGPFSEIL